MARWLVFGLVLGLAIRPSASVLLQHLKSLNNLRDPSCICSSCRIREGVIFRSATPAGVSAADLEAFERQHGRLRVIDLRRKKEALQDDGERLLQGQTTHVDLLHRETVKKRIKRIVVSSRLPLTLPLLPFRLLRGFPVPRVKRWASRHLDRGVRRFLDTIELADIYWWILLDHSEELSQVLRLSVAAAAEGPVLIHCAHGKDRTGVVIALLLYICGTSREAIAADYAMSAAWGCSPAGQSVMLAAMPERFRDRFREWGTALDVEGTPSGSQPEWEQFGRWCSAETTTIDEVWSRVERRWGSMDAYLDSIGVDAAMRSSFVEALSEAQPASEEVAATTP